MTICVFMYNVYVYRFAVQSRRKAPRSRSTEVLAASALPRYIAASCPSGIQCRLTTHSAVLRASVVKSWIRLVLCGSVRKKPGWPCPRCHYYPSASTTSTASKCTPQGRCRTHLYQDLLFSHSFDPIARGLKKGSGSLGSFSKYLSIPSASIKYLFLKSGLNLPLLYSHPLCSTFAAAFV